jgi:hypothetical protein
MKLLCIVSAICLGMLFVCKASAQVLDLCYGVITANSGVLPSCPKGDGFTLAQKNLTISVQVLNRNHDPVPGIPAEEMWLVGVNDRISLCGGSAATNADGPTDSQGRTTFSGALAVGGNDDGLYVVVQGCVLKSVTTDIPIIVPIAVRSVDLYPQPAFPTPGGDGVVSLSDWSLFISLYQNGSYDKCADFDGSGLENIGDLSFMQAHYPQSQPRHECP